MRRVRHSVSTHRCTVEVGREPLYLPRVWIGSIERGGRNHIESTCMTLPQAQQAFRQSPSRATALAYMDAAIEWFMEAEPEEVLNGDMGAQDFIDALQEIRNWLMNERV